MEGKPIIHRMVYLYLTEFFAGMAVMAVELGASRLLAPYFSSSQIVWTIIIGTIMISMALGNMWGGRMADRDADPDRLYKRILVAALWIAAIPVAGKYIVVAISGILIMTVNHNFLIIAAFLSCMIIFVFPLFLLGTVTPSLAKYTMGSLEDSGKIVGTLGACNTVGSIIGTFVPTFVTIPAVGTAVTFLLFSGILLVLTLLYFLSGGKWKKRCLLSVLLFILFSVIGNSKGFAFWENSLAYEGESIYNYLQVKEDEKSVMLSTNVLFGVQSIYMKEENLTGMYYDYALAAPFLAGVEKKEHMDILVLGMGSGTYAGQCKQYFLQAEVEGVEIDEKITKLARTYFSLPEDIKVTTYDGRAYIHAVKKKYDVIMVDAYQDITIPFQMSTVEFFREIKSHLKEDGVMVVNMNMKSDKEGTINDYLSDTIASVFPEVYTVDVVGSTNRELFAFFNEEQIDSLKRAADGLLNKPDSFAMNSQLSSQMEKVYGKLSLYRGRDKILTDDKAPVEVLGMEVIDDLIQEEIGYYQSIFRKEGIQGLLQSVSG